MTCFAVVDIILQKKNEGDILKHYKEYIYNILPCVWYGIICGSITGAGIFGFRFAAKKLEHLSEIIYTEAIESPFAVVGVFAALVAFALLMGFMQKRIPEMKGGGIPCCEGILRGVLSFRRTRTVYGTIIGSFISFLCGLPLGSEGPAVIVGTAIGGLCSGPNGSKSAWSRYVMTGGAAAGFSVATGSPLSAILFALEEIHKRFTPMLVLTVSMSVLSATYVNRLLCGIFRMSPELFSAHDLPDFELGNVGYLLLFSVIVAVAVGIFDASLGYFGKFTKKLKKIIPDTVKLIVVFIFTGILGFCFSHSVHSGHEIIENILSYGESFGLLFAVLAVRMIMMVLVTDSGATGGIFVPTLAIGALVGAIGGRILVFAGMPQEIFPTVVLLGMCAFIGGTLRAPLTATVLFIEFTCSCTNLFYVALVVFVVNFITAVFNQTPFYDRVLERLEENQNKGKTARIVSYRMKVSTDAFVVGKTVRDIMWPHSAVVVSVTRANHNDQDMDNDGEKKLYDGDTLILRLKLYDEKETLHRLRGLVGEQYQIEEVSSV